MSYLLITDGARSSAWEGVPVILMTRSDARRRGHWARTRDSGGSEDDVHIGSLLSLGNFSIVQPESAQ